MAPRLGLLGMALTAALVFAADAQAQARKPALTEREVAQALASGDPARMARALGELRLAGARGARLAPTVERLLRRGLTLELTGLAIEALGAMGQRSSASALTPYARHRSPEVRRVTMGALGRTGATPLLLQGMEDLDQAVRQAAVVALGEARAQEALPALRRALDEGMVEAGVALGRVCLGAGCAELGERVGRQPLALLGPALVEALARPASEVPDPVKIKLAERLRSSGDPGAREVIERAIGRLPPRSIKLREALRRAVP